MKTSPNGVVLKLGGKPFSVKRVPPTIQAVSNFLDKSPADVLYDTDELARHTRVAAHSIACYARKPALAQYRHGCRGTTVLWGHPEAIKELRRQLEATE